MKVEAKSCRFIYIKLFKKDKIQKYFVIIATLIISLLHFFWNIPVGKGLQPSENRNSEFEVRPNGISPPLSSQQVVQKKKERAKISKTGAWIISDKYEYLLDEKLANQLVALFRDNTVIEFGAGTGRYTSYLQNEGINVRGYDGVKTISEMTNGLVHFLDLTNPAGIKPAEWVLCLEVAEHIPRLYENIFIENIQKNSLKGVVLSWAGISQPGVGHVNNREQNYVKKTMTRGGFIYVEESSKLLRDNSKLWWFKKNIMVFLRQKEDKKHTS